MSKRRDPASWLPQSPDLDLAIYVDGSSVPNPGPSGFGLLVLARTGAGDALYGWTRNVGRAGNNVTEFLGLVQAVDLVRSAQARRALIMSDSTVALQLITGRNAAKPEHHERTQQRIVTWLTQNPHVQLCWVERSRNLAHHLARHAASLPAGSEHVTLLAQTAATLPIAV